LIYGIHVYGEKDYSYGTKITEKIKNWIEMNKDDEKLLGNEKIKGDNNYLIKDKNLIDISLLYNTY